MWRGCGMVLIAGFSSLGCSFLFTTTAPDHPERIPPERAIDCTTSNAAPVVDTLVAAYQVVRTFYALSADDAAYANAPISRGSDVALGLAFMGVFGGSALYGYTVTSECSDAKELRRRRYLRLLREREQERESEQTRRQ